MSAGTKEERARLAAVTKHRAGLLNHMARCKVCDPTGVRCERGEALQAVYRRAKHGRPPNLW